MAPDSRSCLLMLALLCAGMACAHAQSRACEQTSVSRARIAALVEDAELRVQDAEAAVALLRDDERGRAVLALRAVRKGLDVATLSLRGADLTCATVGTDVLMPLVLAWGALDEVLLKAGVPVDAPLAVTQ